MSKPFTVSLGDRRLERVFSKQERLLTVTDAALVFDTTLGGTWPDDWTKEKITLQTNYFFGFFKVSWKDGSRTTTLSTDTRKTYLLCTLPCTMLIILGPRIIVEALNTKEYSLTPQLLLYWGVIVAVHSFVLFRPFLRLKRELKKHGYLH